jgi:hypothetical protein
MFVTDFGKTGTFTPVRQNRPVTGSTEPGRGGGTASATEESKIPSNKKSARKYLWTDIRYRSPGSEVRNKAHPECIRGIIIN